MVADGCVLLLESTRSVLVHGIGIGLYQPTLRGSGFPGRVGICLNPDLSEIARVGGSRPYDSDPTGVGIWGIGS